MKLRSSESTTAYLFLQPHLIFFALTVYVPIFLNFYYSVHTWTTAGMTFTGMRNYEELLTSQSFAKVMTNTFLYVGGTSVIAIFLGLGLALILSRPNIKGKKAFRTVYYVPVVTTVVISSYAWLWILETEVGLANFLLYALGLQPQGWLTNARQALPIIVMVGSWVSLGYNTVLFWAGLEAIPKEFYEAATIDGAGTVQRFRHVTFPLLIPTTIFIIIMQFIRSFAQHFGQIYVMTQGGPGVETSLIVFDIWQNAFQFNYIGLASAESFILALVVLVLTMMVLRVRERAKVVY